MILIGGELFGTNIPKNMPYDFTRMVGSKAADRLRGLKGEVHIHLCDRWWEIISPSELQILLINLECNFIPPTVTVSS